MISWIIIYVRRFDRCVEFYRKALGLKLVRVYKGKRHLPWAEFWTGNLRLALHGGHKGPRHRSGGPLGIKFRVKNIESVVQEINRYGGRTRRSVQRFDFRPAELELTYWAIFADPDGNEFEVQQVIREF